MCHRENNAHSLSHEWHFLQMWMFSCKYTSYPAVVKFCFKSNTCLNATTSFLYTQGADSGWHHWNSEAQAVLWEALPRTAEEELWELQAHLQHRNGPKDRLCLQDKPKGSLARLLVKWNELSVIIGPFQPGMGKANHKQCSVISTTSGLWEHWQAFLLSNAFIRCTIVVGTICFPRLPKVTILSLHRCLFYIKKWKWIMCPAICQYERDNEIYECCKSYPSLTNWGKCLNID